MHLRMGERAQVWGLIIRLGWGVYVYIQYLHTQLARDDSARNILVRKVPNLQYNCIATCVDEQF
jgi:hypothetical protein